MTGLAQTILPADKPQIISARILNAPRDLVWKVLTTPEHIMHFWGPDGFTNTIRQMEVKVGGQWLFTMHGPDGTDYNNRIIYRTLTPPSYIAWDHDGGEDDLNGHRFMGELELFEEGNKTRIELRVNETSIAARDAIAKYAVDGGLQNLERLAAYVAPLVDPLNRFVIERSFAVSLTRLFAATTTASEMMQWFAPAGMKIIRSEMDFRVGGTYHYGMANDDGHEMWGKVTYREIKSQSQVLYVQSFSNAQGEAARHPMAPTWPLEMVTLFEYLPEGPNQTKLRITWTYSGIDDAEAATFKTAHAGMAGGWAGTLDNLEKYLA